MKLELLVTYTPAEFAVMAVTFGYELRQSRGEEHSRYHVLGKESADANPVKIWLHSGGLVRQDSFGEIERFRMGEIIATKEPTGSRLSVFAKDENWPHLKESWELLRDEIERRGCIRQLADGKVSDEPNTEPNGETQSGKSNGQSATRLGSGRSGRKRDPQYDEAAERIAGGEAFDVAFRRFCTQVDIKMPDKSVRDSFKAAMKRRQNKT